MRIRRRKITDPDTNEPLELQLEVERTNQQEHAHWVRTMIAEPGRNRPVVYRERRPDET